MGKIKKGVLAIFYTAFIIATLFSFVGCKDTRNSLGLKEQETADMITLYAWFQISGFPSNSIAVNGEKNAVFQLSTEEGELWSGALENDFKKTVEVRADDYTFWRNSMKVDTYIDVVKILEEHIVGYAIIKVTFNEEREWHDATLVKSATFPKVNGEYQAVTKEQVKILISENKK